ncbi:MAG: RtcB family protein [Gallionellaceae bacterium]|nr:RtcB family protein [Gallionellaceae bacterium]
MLIDLNGRVPLKMWLTEIEPGALEQAQHLTQLPFAFHHVAVMPDCHQGYGMPIGGVLATEGTVIPNAVGVDIGCGMLAARTSLDMLDRDTLKAILGDVRKAVPVGFAHHADAHDLGEWMPAGPVSEREANAAKRQVGTLGGGNHFIEVQRGDDGRIWLMLHSGSRNIGLQVAQHYNKLAKALNERWHVSIPAEWDLAFLPLDSNEGVAYLAEMNACLAFAKANRFAMLAAIQGVMAGHVACEWDRIENIHHNYAVLEHHFGHNVLIHRKGATSARAGQVGIIPGSQGTRSYIVKGLGHPDSFTSCSHGAGRKMGRKQAERTLDLADEQRKLDEQGILHALRGKGGLDEAPGAYKSIDEVMAQQTDLVAIEVGLQPLAVVKG